MHTRDPNDLTTVDLQTFQRLAQDSHRLQALLDQQARAREEYERTQRVGGLYTALFITRDGLAALATVPQHFGGSREASPVFIRALYPPRGAALDVSGPPSTLDSAVGERRYSLDGYKEFDGRCIPVYRED